MIGKLLARERLVGWLLALFATVVVLVGQRDVGIARDEVVYYQAGSKYADWWLGLVTFDHGISRESVTGSFGGKSATDNNREHPPLLKTAFGLSERLLHDTLGIASETTAYRVPSALMHGLFVALVFFFAASIAGSAPALIAALLALFLPRAIFHASLACFDAPIMTLWFATVYAYWRALTREGSVLTLGVVFGLALATKHTALLLPFGLGLHYLVLGVRIARREKSGLRALTHRLDIILSLALVAPLTLYVVWPWLWFAPVAHVKDWLTFHLTHVHYNFEYLGQNWNAPRFPWHTALVTTLFTVPTATLAAAFAGGTSWVATYTKTPPAERHPHAPALLLALSAAASIGPFFLGTTPIFGAEKHWMPILPTIAIAGGVGVVAAARLAAALVPRPRAASLAIGALGTLVVLAAVTETRAAHPYGLTWYSALAGGAPGGADHGMNRQFWGVAARGILPLLPRLAPGGAEVYTHDASPAWGMYQREGLVPRTYRDAGREEGGIARSKLAFVVHEKHFNRHDYLIWKSYKTATPVFVLRADGVPIVSVYARDPVPAEAP